MPHRMNRPREKGGRKRAVASRTHHLLHSVLAAADDAGRTERALPPPVGGFERARAWLAEQPLDVAHVARRWLHALADRAPHMVLARTSRGEIGASVIVRAASMAPFAINDGAHTNMREEEEGWRAQGRGRRALESWLLRTFTVYPVPRWVIAATMLRGTVMRAAGERDDDAPLALLPHVGQGRSWRRAPLPSSVDVTRALAHELASTTIEGPRLAIRSAQMRTRALTPERAEMLAQTFAQSRFGTQAMEACRMRFVDFVVRVQDEALGLDARELALLLSWFEHEVELGADALSFNGFSFNGRTVRSILAMAFAKARNDARLARKLGLLPPSGIAGGVFPVRSNTGGVQTFQIAEIDSGEGLAVEGLRRRHCVGSYVRKVQRGVSAIFRVDEARTVSAEVGVTIEVALATRSLAQVKGYANRAPTPQERAAVAAWASTRGLSWST
jgi:hypothetical protein